LKHSSLQHNRFLLQIGLSILARFHPFNTAARAGREIGKVWTGDPEGYRPNLPFTWGAQPHQGFIYFNDINSGLWVVKLGPKIDKGSTTAPGP
jgi:hypothetical protein